MSVTTSETGTLGLHSLENYAPLSGAAAVERILNKSEPLRALHAIHVSSTFYGGGVTEILTPLTLKQSRRSKGSASSTAAVSARHWSAGLPPNEWLETMSGIITRWPAGLQSQL